MHYFTKMMAEKEFAKVEVVVKEKVVV